MNKIFLKLLILLFSQIGFYNAYANFGESCITPSIVDNTGYLNTNTAYGYLLQNIDMKINVQGCALDGDSLKFCIRNNISAPICTPVEMRAGNVVALKDINNNPEIGAHPLLSTVLLKAEIQGNMLCLLMQTSRGNVPLVCRQYNAENTPVTLEQSVCRNLGNSCYDGATKSQALLSFSGITIHCVRETLDKVFYQGNDCQQDEESISFTMLSPFPKFQKAMKTAISGALILYVMFYGFKLVMNNEYANLNKIALFILKFIFVVYFSVGFGQLSNSNNKAVNHNGMTETALPMLLQLTSDFTEIIFLSGGSQGLCNYDASKYEDGYEFYKVWDAIDCRLGYYFGVQILYNIFGSLPKPSGSTASSTSSNSAANFGNKGDDGVDALDKVGAFSFFIVMFGFFMAGSIVIVICGIIFAVIFLSIIFYFLNAYLVSMVTLYVMMYISPIFVPMLLFDRTKAYFDSWVRIVVSCALQPAVIGGFIALLLTMYDSVFYGNCEYLRHDYQDSGINFSTFELREPANEPEKCQNSLGYKLVKYYLGQGWEKKTVILFEIFKISDFLNVSLSMIYMLIFVFIFYFALQSIHEFVSDLTGGPNMSAVTVSPTAFMEKAFAAAQKLQAAMSKKSGDKEDLPDNKGDKGKKEGGDKGGEAGDKASTDSSGSGGASDKASSGGGASGGGGAPKGGGG